MFNIKTILLITFLVPFGLYAQDISDVIDPSIINELSDDEIALIKNQINNQQNTDTESSENTSDSESIIENENYVEYLVKSDENKFGYNYFKTMPTSIDAGGDLPLPNDYKISLKDTITIILSGSKDLIFDLSVNLDGTILFPEIGSIFIAGETFFDVREKLRNIINQTYIGVNLDMSIKDLSAKKISIVGLVNMPGTYLVNPFTTVSGALAYSGGIDLSGTLRNIKLVRINGDTHHIDLYDLLINGDRTNDLTIESGDVIIVNAISNLYHLRVQLIDLLSMRLKMEKL